MTQRIEGRISEAWMTAEVARRVSGLLLGTLLFDDPWWAMWVVVVGSEVLTRIVRRRVVVSLPVGRARWAVAGRAALLALIALAAVVFVRWRIVAPDRSALVPFAGLAGASIWLPFFAWVDLWWASQWRTVLPAGTLTPRERSAVEAALANAREPLRLAARQLDRLQVLARTTTAEGTLIDLTLADPSLRLDPEMDAVLDAVVPPHGPEGGLASAVVVTVRGGVITQVELRSSGVPAGA